MNAHLLPSKNLSGIPNHDPIHTLKHMVPAHTAARQKCKSMKAVIIEDGIGAQISEKTQLKPKLMIKIGGHPTHISANNEDLLHTWRERLCDFLQISRLDHQGIFQKSFSLNFKNSW